MVVEKKDTLGRIVLWNEDNNEKRYVLSYKILMIMTRI